MKVIFLDIDGVLTTEKDVHTLRFRDFSSDCVENLKRVFRGVPDARVVFSTSWRYIQFDLGYLWNKHGFEKDIVIGYTPLNLLIKGKMAERGEEINEWLKTRSPFVWDSKVRKDVTIDGYAIIDDDVFDILPHVPKETVFRTDILDGLTAPIAEDIIKFLNTTSNQAPMPKIESLT